MANSLKHMVAGRNHKSDAEGSMIETRQMPTISRQRSYQETGKSKSCGEGDVRVQYMTQNQDDKFLILIK